MKRPTTSAKKTRKKGRSKKKRPERSMRRLPETRIATRAAKRARKTRKRRIRSALRRVAALTLKVVFMMDPENLLSTTRSLRSLRDSEQVQG